MCWLLTYQCINAPARRENRRTGYCLSLFLAPEVVLSRF